LAAYIDPGTGSMLFSFLTGIAVTLFFFVKNVLIKFKSGSLFGMKTRAGPPASAYRKHSLVIYSEGKQYWNVFKPVLEELAWRNLPCVYYTSDETDPGLGFSASPLIQTACIGKGNAAYQFLNFLEADLCLMTTPGLDVFQLKRSPGVKHYSHILHMVTDATTYRLFGLDYYDSVLLTGTYQERDLRVLETKRGTPKKALFVAGCTYLDVLAGRIAALPPQEQTRPPCKTVLVAPSWGANGILRRYGMKLLEPLAKTSCRLIIRPHPQSMISEQTVVQKLQVALAPYQVEWNFDAENLNVLSRADIMISDFSGVFFDYAFLFNRPVLYPRFEFDKRPYDAGDMEEELWTFRAIRKIGVPVDEEQFNSIGDVLEGILQDAEKIDVIKKLKEEAWMYRGEAGKRVVDVLSTILENVI
jgi:hypothetical protein